MATIPRGFNEVSGTIQPGALPTQTSGVTRDMVSAEEGFGKEIGVAADAVQKFAVARQGKLDLEEFEGTMAAYKTWELGRKRTAYSNKMHDAKNIFESEKAVMDNWLEGDGSSSHQAFKQKHDGMSDRQKRRIALAIAVRQPDYMNAIGIHQDQQTDAALLDSYKSSLGATITSYTLAVTDAEQKRELSNMASSVKGIGVVKGWNAAMVTEEILAKQAIAHQGMIRVMLSQEGLEGRETALADAKAYAQKYTANLTETSRVSINNAIAAEEIDLTATMLAVEAESQPDPIAYIMDKTKDGTIRGKAFTHLNRIEGWGRRKRAEQKTQSENAVYKYIMDNRATAGKIDLSRITDPEIKKMYDLLDSTGKERMESKLKSLREGEPFISNRSNSRYYQEVVDMISTDMEKFKSLNLDLMYHDKIKPGTLQALQNKQLAEKESDSSELGHQKKLNDLYDHYKWVGAEHQPRKGTANIKMDQAVAAFKKSHNGIGPTDAEFNKIVKDTFTASFLKQTEEDFPVPGDKITQEFGRSITVRVNDALKAEGYEETGTDGDPQLFATVRNAAEAAEIRWSEANGGAQVPNGVRNKIADVLARDKIYIKNHKDKKWGWFNINADDHKLRSVAEAEGSLPEDFYVIVNEEIVELNKINAWLGTKHKDGRLIKEVVSERLDRYRLPATAQNIAELWRGTNKHVKLSSIRIPNNDNENGKTITKTELAEYVRGLNVNQMEAGKKIIVRDYGGLAGQAYDNYVVQRKQQIEDEKREME